MSKPATWRLASRGERLLPRPCAPSSSKVSAAHFCTARTSWRGTRPVTSDRGCFVWLRPLSRSCSGLPTGEIAKLL